ncbi:MAG: hypothetical protein J6Z11_17260 [Candidatus Riflebacteria bacterium]|nr:hypothetical protein [Candidatus Riflebacteria bacterium]
MNKFITVHQQNYYIKTRSFYNEKVYTGTYKTLYINKDLIVAYKDNEIETRTNIYEDLKESAKEISKLIGR